ncbi:glycosyltransferase family 39 protein [Duganella aceris]|uniref:Glycosyltransferase family 39 protein n=1 Tax=Duganella aceris TaxID=2703883 RepID=A0ABX0FJY9_9BURK|nr:glycosyltransferase family 39 protein [Duganella aceris]NGZ84784.1 glycosyltransferase family 39 protein [Duganella aceris]
MSDFFRSKAALYLLAACFILLSLLVLDIRTLIPPDEGRYAEMAREMFVTGDWVTTRLNGIKYFEKPPLHTWMSALSFTLFGPGEWQARLWNGVCGIFGVLMVGYTGQRIFGGRSGLYAAMVLASMTFWAAASQFNSLDLGVAATMSLALCALLIAQQDDVDTAQRHRWMLLCWAGMALSLLAKGLIGIVLPGGVLFIYALTSGDRGIWRRLHPFSGLALFLLMSLPWFLLVAQRNPEQPQFFFIHEHWDRFFLKTHHREGPWYYFLVLLLPATLPWIVALPASLALARKRMEGRFQTTRLLLAWIGFILFFFSISKSKLPGYMLPVFPALALLAGVYLERASRATALSLAALLAVVGAIGLAFTPYTGKLAQTPTNLAIYVSMQPMLSLAFLAALLAGVAAWFAERRGLRGTMVLAAALGGWLLTQFTMAAYEPYGRFRAGTDLVQAIRGELTEAATIYSVGTYQQSMTFYMGHTVIPVQYTDELEFGLQQEPQRGIATLEQFYARWRQDAAGGKPQYAIVNAGLFGRLQQQGLPMSIRARTDDLVLVSGTAP